MWNFAWRWIITLSTEFLNNFFCVIQITKISDSENSWLFLAAFFLLWSYNMKNYYFICNGIVVKYKGFEGWRDHCMSIHIDCIGMGWRGTKCSGQGLPLQPFFFSTHWFSQVKFGTCKCSVKLFFNCQGAYSHADRSDPTQHSLQAALAKCTSTYQEEA